MIKMRNFLLYILVIFGTISTVSAKGLFSNSYAVSFDKTLEQVQVRAELMDKDKSYQKRFTAKDKMGNLHTITIYDDEYMKIDNVFYAYKFRNLMHYGLTLNVMGDIKSVNGFKKLWGLQGYATAVNNPDTTISFIFCKDMYPMKSFSSMFEANQISGVSFSGRNPNDGYVDDFGYWRSYEWTDYFERIFNTRNKDVKMRMYMAMQVAK